MSEGCQQTNLLLLTRRVQTGVGVLESRCVSDEQTAGGN